MFICISKSSDSGLCFETRSGLGFSVLQKISHTGIGHCTVYTINLGAVFCYLGDKERAFLPDFSGDVGAGSEKVERQTHTGAGRITSTSPCWISLCLLLHNNISRLYLYSEPGSYYDPSWGFPSPIVVLAVVTIFVGLVVEPSMPCKTILEFRYVMCNRYTISLVIIISLPKCVSLFMCWINQLIHRCVWWPLLIFFEAWIC